MDEAMIYWITRCDTIKGIFQFMSIAGFIFSIGIGLMTVIGSFDHDMALSTNTLRCFKCITCTSIICFILFGLAYCFTPTTKEMFAIKCIPAIASKENVEKFKTIGNDMLDATAAYIKDLKKSK